MNTAQMARRTRVVQQLPRDLWPLGRYGRTDGQGRSLKAQQAARRWGLGRQFSAPPTLAVGAAGRIRSDQTGGERLWVGSSH